MNEVERIELIQRIMEDISANFASYHDWILDTMRDTVEKWSDDELLSFVGEKDV